MCLSYCCPARVLWGCQQWLEAFKGENPVLLLHLVVSLREEPFHYKKE